MSLKTFTYFCLALGGLTPLGAIFGGLLAGVPLSHVGRRETLLIVAVCYFISFVLMGTSSLHEILPVMLISRGIGGLGVGMAMPAAQIYVGIFYLDRYVTVLAAHKLRLQS
jgi:MFS family permease